MFVFQKDPVDRQRDFLKSLYFMLMGALFAMLMTYGIAGVTGYSSVTVQCLENGTFTIAKTSEFSGTIMIVIALFLLLLAPLAYCQCRREYKRFHPDENDGL